MQLNHTDTVANRQICAIDDYDTISENTFDAFDPMFVLALKPLAYTLNLTQNDYIDTPQMS